MNKIKINNSLMYDLEMILALLNVNGDSRNLNEINIIASFFTNSVILQNDSNKTELYSKIIAILMMNNDFSTIVNNESNNIKIEIYDKEKNFILGIDIQNSTYVTSIYTNNKTIYEAPTETTKETKNKLEVKKCKRIF